MIDTKNIINISSVEDYNKLCSTSTHHDLITVVNLMGSQQSTNSITFNYQLYAIFLKNSKTCRIRYGYQECDYGAGTIVTFAPGMRVTVEYTESETPPDAIGILFHPDLIYRTSLGDKINNYTFFNYSQREALHINESERRLLIDCIQRIDKEIEVPMDSHSNNLIVINIQLILEYLSRFYDRQFITRHKINTGVVAQFEKDLYDYFDSGQCKQGLPLVSFFAEKVRLTSGYFGDLVKRELGITAQDVISNHLIKRSKQKLAATNDDVAVIAYDLGFQYPQHFTRLFKRITGQTPTQYRKSLL